MNKQTNIQAPYSLKESAVVAKTDVNVSPKLDITIAKFGGTSVANFEAMTRCADLILSQKNTKLVVLSASAGVTNHLVKLANGLAEDALEATFAEIKKIQEEILGHIKAEFQPTNEVNELLNRIHTLALACQAQTISSDKRRMLADELVAHGELLSTTLFTGVMKQRGVLATFFDIRQVMKTDSYFGRAMPKIELIARYASKSLKTLLENHIVITQGFIGSNEQDETTTLGRGGSDYSAALIAEALNASEVAIWTDVPGIYTTDPRIAPQARPIKNISFVEAAEMATFGAKILHPATLLPAVRANIPVFIGSSKDPSAGGTYVSQVAQETPLFRALTLRRDQTLLTLHSLQMLHARGFLAEVFAILAKHQISVDLITTSEISVSLTLDTTGSTTTGDALITPALLDELSSLCRVEVEADLTLVALIGNHLTQSAGAGADIFDVLSPYPIRSICFGASSHNFCVLVPAKNADDIVKALHKKLFE